MRWSANNSTVPSDVATTNDLFQSNTCTTLPLTIPHQNDSQMIHQLRPCDLVSLAHFSTLSLHPNSRSSKSTFSSFGAKKKPTPVPENLKDAAYRERRLRNNESARKSRELRRQKEECTQIRCCQLAHENHILRTELSLLRAQIEQFRQILSSISQNSQTNIIIPYNPTASF
ncbi:unnamed protein product [Thelazia callipaeda]|uniref:BZIP domain-containing protein n=1 Tax=Thelazia callipaeda TaxID=103827 RepID=A0A0N5D5E2_THECL|nr:unnamed protein product [Thelazia callipaeda]